MKQNMNKVDRLVRLFIAALFGFFCWVGQLTGGWAIACLAVFVFLAVTAIIGWCPLYLLAGTQASVNKNGG
jgi:hypothetical protein